MVLLACEKFPSKVMKKMINQKENMSENYLSEYFLGRLFGPSIGHSRTLPKIGSDRIYL